MSEFSALQETVFPKGAYLSHFSLEVPVTCIIHKFEANALYLSCSREVSNILKGDPVIIKFLNQENEWIITGDVVSVKDASILNILVTGVETYQNNRKDKRYAASLNAVVAGIGSMDYICSTVKTISYSGISVNCKHSFDADSLLVISIITSTINVIHFIAKVARKRQVQDYFEYGVEISSIVSPNKEKLEDYVNFLEETEKSFIEHINK